MRSLRRIASSSDEEEARAGSAQMVAEQDAAHRRESRHIIRRAARKFVETVAVVEGGADSGKELESANASTASNDSFIIRDDVWD